MRYGASLFVAPLQQRGAAQANASAGEPLDQGMMPRVLFKPEAMNAGSLSG
ncbi:MAG: hypothetical protein ACI841_005062 [Planctomycetota bacterium]